jgi:hypothetical protein
MQPKGWGLSRTKGDSAESFKSQRSAIAPADPSHLIFGQHLGCRSAVGLLLETQMSEQAPWRKIGLERRSSGSMRDHLATHLNWIFPMAQLLRDADKCADPIDILGAIAALGERECPI